jgi:uncharacterized cupin superfamily protein
MSKISTFRLDRAEPQPYDVDPDTIVEGAPQQAAVVCSTAPDGTTVAGVFRATRGTFRATQAGDEWTLVLKGRVIVTADDGSAVECAAGDVMTLQRGATYTFEVLEDLEDYFVITNPEGVTL